jgi:hypothetical protein
MVEADVIKILEITQKTVQSEIQDLIANEDWGMPQGYDITVTRKGEKLTTEYTVQPSPHKELTEPQKKAIEMTKINLNALFENGDPFDGKNPEPQFETTNTPPTTEQYDNTQAGNITASTMTNNLDEEIAKGMEKEVDISDINL